MTVKTDDVSKGRKDLDPHRRLRAVTGGSGANGLKDLQQEPIKLKMIAPTGVRVRFNAGTTHKLYSLTDGRQKSSGWGGGAVEGV